MGKQYALYTQNPKPEKKGVGFLSIDRNGDANFFSGTGAQGCSMIARMVRAKIDFAAADGIMVSGFEPCGVERDGKKKFRYQEWWLAYEEKHTAEAEK